VPRRDRHGDWRSPAPQTPLHAINTWRGHGNGLFDLDWSPDDTWLASASADLRVRIWDPMCTNAAPVGNNVVPGCNNEVEDWDGDKALRSLEGHESTAKCVSWRPKDKNVLASGGRGGEVCIWDLRAKDALVTTIWGAHEDGGATARKGRKSGGSITGLVWTAGGEALTTSGSVDG
jgi:denticleless